MTTKVTMDKAGRVVIPRAFREELELAPGDNLELESEGDQMVLRPLVNRPALEKERGVWVYRTGQRLPASLAQHTLKRVRERGGRRSRVQAE
jgi:AbrB family looped-hinge helix DNA binding protein